MCAVMSQGDSLWGGLGGTPKAGGCPAWGHYRSFSAHRSPAEASPFVLSFQSVWGFVSICFVFFFAVWKFTSTCKSSQRCARQPALTATQLGESGLSSPYVPLPRGYQGNSWQSVISSTLSISEGWECFANITGVLPSSKS